MFVLFFYAQLLKLGEYIWANSNKTKKACKQTKTSNGNKLN